MEPCLRACPGAGDDGTAGEGAEDDAPPVRLRDSSAAADDVVEALLGPPEASDGLVSVAAVLEAPDGAVEVEVGAGG